MMIALSVAQWRSLGIPLDPDVAQTHEAIVARLQGAQEVRAKVFPRLIVSAEDRVLIERKASSSADSPAYPNDLFYPNNPYGIVVS